MQFFSATLLFVATVAATSASISVNKDVIRQIINQEQNLLNEGRQIFNQLSSDLSSINSAFQGNAAAAIRVAQEAAINAQQQANQNMDK
ncbi:hypothetical protein FBU31_007707, partial [Coemansia sp. 'formosensis']